MIAGSPLATHGRSSRLPLPMKTILAGALVCLAVAAAGRAAAAGLEAFPAAESGMVRHVISLPPLADESLVKVELTVGRTVRIDAGNRYFFGGELQIETVPGWGYDRYVLPELGPLAGTLMAIDPDAPRVDRFITLGGEPPLIRYNSRVPIVVYLPTGVEVRHRLWRADSLSAEGARFVQKLRLPGKRVAVISEGDWEARSIGSYSVRIYSTEHSAAEDDTTFFVSAVTRKRDGFIERVLLAELAAGEPPGLVVVIRSAGSGGYLSADAFDVGGDGIQLRGSVDGLPAQADPVQGLVEALRSGRQRQ